MKARSKAARMRLTGSRKEKKCTVNMLKGSFEEGKAYYAFDTPEQLDDMRKRLEAAKVAAAQYNAITRTEMTNSLTLSAEETKARLRAVKPM
jgi:glutamyl/glutaminyl-tRNA synthetase